MQNINFVINLRVIIKRICVFVGCNFPMILKYIFFKSCLQYFIDSYTYFVSFIFSDLTPVVLHDAVADSESGAGDDGSGEEDSGEQQDEPPRTIVRFKYSRVRKIRSLSWLNFI